MSLPTEWVPIKQATSRAAEVWNHFLRNSTDPKQTKCKYCPKTYGALSTDSARYHIEKVHLIKPTPKADTSDAKKTASNSNQPSIRDALTTRDSLHCVYARLAAADRISFQTLESSIDIQEGLRARGYSVLKSRKAIKKHIFDFASEVRLKIKETLKSKILQSEKFSMTLDEYTSTNNRRYWTWISFIRK